MKKYSGFTLLELIVTVAIVGIVMAIGVPSMQTYTLNDRLTTQINTLVGHLALARSEAVKRNQQVVICPSDNVGSNAPTCDSDWSKGWIVFIDSNGDASPSGEEVLRENQELAGGNALTSSVANSRVVYDYRGFASGSTGTFSLCDSRGTAHMKAISISNTGRVRKEAASTC